MKSKNNYYYSVLISLKKIITCTQLQGRPLYQTPLFPKNLIITHGSTLPPTNFPINFLLLLLTTRTKESKGTRSRLFLGGVCTALHTHTLLRAHAHKYHIRSAAAAAASTGGFLRARAPRAICCRGRLPRLFCPVKRSRERNREELMRKKKKWNIGLASQSRLKAPRREKEKERGD